MEALKIRFMKIVLRFITHEYYMARRAPMSDDALTLIDDLNAYEREVTYEN